MCGPLTVFSFPDKRPFYGGTHFPKDTWYQIRGVVKDKYRYSSGELKDSADALEKGIEDSGKNILRISGCDGVKADLSEEVNAIIDLLDLDEGGVKGAPKFPMPVLFRFLMSWSALKTDQRVLDLTVRTFEKMAAGGIYDRIEGGFARYSTDRFWKVPHFKKMLYDNSQLITLYSEAFSFTGNSKFRKVTLESLEFIYRNMTSKEGFFYSAVDADSCGSEGVYYTWYSREMKQILGDDYALAKDRYGVDGPGLWKDGRNILLEAREDEVLLESFGLTDSELQIRKARIQDKLMEAGLKRVHPRRDDKALISWNGLMITACCEANKAFGRIKDL